jgi:hypothetical protein
MRRSFDGDALYRAIFTEYVTRLVVGGHPIEFFIEGKGEDDEEEEREKERKNGRNKKKVKKFS